MCQCRCSSSSIWILHKTFGHFIDCFLNVSAFCLEIKISQKLCWNMLYMCCTQNILVYVCMCFHWYHVFYYKVKRKTAFCRHISRAVKEIYKTGPRWPARKEELKKKKHGWTHTLSLPDPYYLSGWAMTHTIASSFFHANESLRSDKNKELL